jgi:uncharacterized membrane protein (DUF373 family)|tara:strand:- start:3869 stop:4081 length:213 start_codon:yes stop_codon:yes gene_type:complete
MKKYKLFMIAILGWIGIIVTIGVYYIAIMSIIKLFKISPEVMKILTIVWGILIIFCILEAYFCTKFDDEL